MRPLPPLILRDKYYLGIEKAINRVLLEKLYMPLASVVGKPREILNTGSVLYEAVVSGRIWYLDGAFHGSFNSRISKALEAIGATFNIRSKTFSLRRADVPAELSMAQANADSRYNALRRAMVQTLDDLDIDSITRNSAIPSDIRKAVDWMDVDFKKTLASITIPPTLTDEQRDIISKEWGKNLELYVQGWTQENVLSMREKVTTNAFAGRRADQLVSMIQESYGASQRKARFLARQETSLLMAKFRETRYRCVGITRYRWSTSHDERVRHDHKHLNGKIFSWDNPPVTNLKTGARNNPGEDFGCRCIAIALVE